MLLCRKCYKLCLLCARKQIYIYLYYIQNIKKVSKFEQMKQKIKLERREQK